MLVLSVISIFLHCRIGVLYIYIYISLFLLKWLNILSMDPWNLLLRYNVKSWFPWLFFYGKQKWPIYIYRLTNLYSERFHKILYLTIEVFPLPIVFATVARLTCGKQLPNNTKFRLLPWIN